MLVLSSAINSPVPQVSFTDHADSQVVHYLPSALVLASTPAGQPDFFLLRYHGDLSEAQGGLLNLRLRFKTLDEEAVAIPKEAGQRMRRVLFEAGRFRLRLRSLLESGHDEVGNWHAIPLTGKDVLAMSVSLSTHESQLLKGLLEEGQSAVEIELDLRYQGLVVGKPWLVNANREALEAHLEAVLGNESVREDQIVAAFLSLPEKDGGIVNWYPLEPEATGPPRDWILNEVGLRSLTTLFSQEAGSDFEKPNYRFAPKSTDQASISWDLLTPRQEQRTHAMSWSVSELYQQLTDPELRRQLFPIASDFSPFEKVRVFVINHLPFDSNGLRQITLDIRHTGSSGVPEFRSFTFKGAESDVAEFTTVYPAVTTSFQLDYRVTAQIAPSGGVGWPKMWRREFTPAERPLVEISGKTAGIDFVRLEAEDEVFERAGKIEVSLLHSAEGPSLSSSMVPQSNGPAAPTPPQPVAMRSLTQEKPTAWVALPGIDCEALLLVRVLAYAKGEAAALPLELFSGAVLNRAVKVAAYQLEVFEPDRVSVSLDSELAASFAYVAVTIRASGAREMNEGKFLPLDAGQPRVWSRFRSSIFEPPRFEYCIHYVAMDSSGKTLPMASTDWISGEGSSLIVRPPALTKEAGA